MCLRIVYLLITRSSSWPRLSRHEESWKTAEILILPHQLTVLQRRQPRRPAPGLGGPGIAHFRIGLDLPVPMFAPCSLGYRGTPAAPGIWRPAVDAAAAQYGRSRQAPVPPDTSSERKIE